MTSSDYVTGLTIDLVPASNDPRSTTERRTPHAVDRRDVDGSPRARCGAQVQRVLADRPFPPGVSLDISTPACRACLRVVQ